MIPSMCGSFSSQLSLAGEHEDPSGGIMKKC